MAHLEFSKEITALLVIDPYNEFISAGSPSIDNRTARIRTEKACVVINSRIVGKQEVGSQPMTVVAQVHVCE